MLANKYKYITAHAALVKFMWFFVSILKALSKWSQTHREWKRIWLKQPKCGFQTDCSGNDPLHQLRWVWRQAEVCTVTFHLGFIHLVEGKSNVLPRNDVTLISAAVIELRESLGNIRGSLERCPPPSGPAGSCSLGHKNKEVSGLHQPWKVKKSRGSREDAPARGN